MQKWCRYCQTDKDLADFPVRKTTGKSMPRCKACRTRQALEWREKNQQRAKKTASARYERTRDEVLKKAKEYRATHLEQERAQDKKYHAKHRAEIAERMRQKRIEMGNALRAKERQYYQEHRDRERAIKRQSTQRTRDKVLARAKARYQKNRLMILTQAKVYRERNREAIRGQLSDWRRRNRDLIRSYHYRRRARAMGAGGQSSPEDLRKLMRRYGGRCAYCKHKPANTFDHVIPVSRGGTSYIGNLLPACKSCNCSKGTKTIMEWQLAQRRLTETASD